MTDDDLARLDRALLRLRRMWDAPTGIAHEGRTVEGSTLLVCLAVAEGPAGHPEGGTGAETGVVEVAEALGVTHSTASRLVSRAVEAGMVVRGRSAVDPRRVALRLSAEGEGLVAASRRFRAGRLGAALAAWPPGDVADLADLLTRFADDVTRPGPP